MSTTNRVNSGEPLHGQSRSKPHGSPEEGVTTIPKGSRAKRPEARGDHKRCCSCNEHKPRSEFNKHSRQYDGLQHYCKSCQADDKRCRRYGVTRDWYLAKLEEQGHCCAICGVHIDNYTYGSKQVFSIDHDHMSGKPRGLLCNNCNIGLGCFQDDPKIIAKSARYLRKHRELRSMI